MSNINRIENCSRTSLHSACKNQDLELVKSLLKNGENPNAVDNNMNTSLHWACSSKSDVTATIIELLLQHNANIEAPANEYGWTPLFIACDHKNDVAIKCLLENHANLNATDKLGNTPLFYTVEISRSISVAQLLLQYNANIDAVGWDGRTPLLEACHNCDYEVAKFFLDNHANPFAADNNGCTSLYLVCQTKKKMTVPLIELLLQYNVNIEAANAEGWIPLIEACANDNLDAMKCLLDHHANIEAKDHLGMTPLSRACIKNNYDVIEYLLDHHANINAVDRKGQTPLTATYYSEKYNALQSILGLDIFREFKVIKNWAHNISNNTQLHTACKIQDLELVKRLLKNGENPNAVDSKKNTPLHLACRSKSDVTATIIELLLQNNANIEAAENECGWTPLFTACVHNNDVAVKCLLENHANPNAMDRIGYRPLHWISFCNSDDIALSIAQLLLQYNVNIEARSKNGRTPFLMACWNCNYVAAKFLLDNNANPFAADNDGCTSLHLVCDKKNDATVTLIELLVQHNANIEAVDKKGWTPFMVASNRGNCDAIQYLFDHYANVNHSDINNSTALHIAIERQSVETTKCLMKCNADINLLDKENQTPLEKALKMESSNSYPSEIVRILIFEVAKLKVAGFKIHDHNLDILHNYNVRWPLLIDESRYTDEIEQMKKKNIGDNDVTLYDFLKNDIRFLFQFVTDEEIQHQLKQEDLDEQFPSYINIIRSRFREATIQCTQNESHLGTLMCLTQQVPEIDGAEPEVLSQVFDNIAYIMPGL